MRHTAPGLAIVTPLFQPGAYPQVSTTSQFSLLRQRRFAPFFATQFLGAFNDNIFRNGLVILVTFQSTQVAGLNASELANVAGALFILPFFLFSASAGQLADKFEKSRLIRAIKLFEVVLMALAAYAFVSGSYNTLLLVLFLMGCQSTLFGPVKYAYLPQQLATEELVGGNALVGSGTYMAIIFGLIVGGLSVAIDPDTQVLLASCLIAVALLGYMASRGIPVTRAVDPELTVNWNAWTETWRIVSYARRDRSVFLSVLGHFVVLVFRLRPDTADTRILSVDPECERRDHDDTAGSFLGGCRHRLAVVRKDVGAPHRTWPCSFRVNRAECVCYRPVLRATGSECGQRQYGW
ncbi:MAG: MFS transporter [Woeseiaceae bacterium]|nr:MFS transporter [Woeseiaceae bacterium]